jgi:hypothetical protein
VKASVVVALLALAVPPARADDAAPASYREELVTSARMASGEPVPYVLDSRNASPRYVVILFPGGTGEVDPRIVNGKLVYRAKRNFLLRARPFLVDDEFAAVASNASSRPERIQALLDDLRKRFPEARIYLMGTSRGTLDTLTLAGYLSDKIAGEIHTSSFAVAVASFDPHKYRNRQLLVHHVDDDCRATPFAAAERSHERFGTTLIAMRGGKAEGDPCQPFGHHGYNGVEQETIDAIKQWIRQGG